MRNPSKIIRWLWYGTALAAAAGAIHGATMAWTPESPWHRAMQIAMHIVTAAVYLSSTLVCRRIIADHREGSTMRVAWILFTASAALSAIRHSFESLSFALGWVETSLTTFVSLRQIPIALSLVVLIAALAAVWSSFTSIGLGLRPRAVDWILIALIVALAPSTFVFRSEMSDAQSTYAFIRHLQSASPVLLAAPALIAIALQRISVEMGGGQLALALRCIVAFLIIRLASLYLGLVPAYAGMTIVSRSLWWAASWLFLLGAAYRWSVTVSADALAQRYETDPTSELAGASRAIAFRPRDN